MSLERNADPYLASTFWRTNPASMPVMQPSRSANPWDTYTFPTSNRPVTNPVAPITYRGGGGAASASQAANQVGMQQQQAQGTAMASASNTDPYRNLDPALAERYRQQAAAAAGMGAAANAGSAAASTVGQNQQMAQGRAMANASMSPSVSMPPVMGNQPPAAGQPGFQTQYSTPGNLQPYFKPFNFQEDPGYQFALDQGIRALDRSAAAGGLLGSTRNQNDILRFATGLAGQQYQDAWGRNRAENLDALSAFTGDRNYMTDQYWTNRGANLSEADAANRWNYGLYQDEQQAYQNMMNQFYGMLNDLSQTGQTAADRSGAIESWLGQNLASLYGDIGNVNAGAAQASGANNQNLVEGLLSVFGSLLGGG